MDGDPGQVRARRGAWKLTLPLALLAAGVGWGVPALAAPVIGVLLAIAAHSAWRRLGPCPDVAEYRRSIINLRSRLADRTRLLREAYLDMQSLDRVKETFLSNLSHEMRTPLTSIMAAEEILSNYGEESAETRAEFLNIIRQESNRLLELMGKLLDLAKLEAKALDLKYQRIDLNELVAETVAMIQAQRSEVLRRVRIVEPDEPTWCDCDPERVRHILHNMLENAARYASADAPVAVRISADPNFALVAVEDGGAFTDNRFTDMFESENIEDDDTHGTPFLGHPIAARLAAMHNGSLRPESTDGGGTVVTLRLPLEQPVPSGEMVGR